MRGNNVMLGYYKDPEATAEAFRGVGFILQSCYAPGRILRNYELHTRGDSLRGLEYSYRARTVFVGSNPASRMAKRGTRMES
jgi:acyl-CoA synthetase (AMP-forming)/AMP-acid ligase II